MDESFQTERERAEQARRERDATIRGLFDANIIGISVGERDGRLIDANDTYLRIVGYDREDLLAGRISWMDMTPTEWIDRSEQALSEFAMTGAAQPYEKEYFRKDGSRVPVLVGLARIEGSERHITAFVLDLTERKRAEQVLHEDEVKIRRLFDANIVGIEFWDFEGRVLEANDAFLRIAGYDRDDLIAGRVHRDRLTPPEWRDHVARRVAELRMAGTIQPYEREFVRKDGSRVPVLVAAARFDETADQGVAFVLDLTERKKTEEELRASEARFRTFVDHATDSFMLHAEDGTILDVNRHACESLGYSRDELIGMGVIDFEPDANATFRPGMWERLGAGEILTFESRHRRKDGTEFPVEVRLREFEQGGRRVSLTRDITERKRAEADARESERRYRETQAELARANRVATMGQLTASIAHEVNQPIGAAVTNANAALRWLSAQRPDLEEVRQALRRIVENGNRASEVIGRIRALIKKAPPRKEGVAINDAILGVVTLIHGEVVKNRVSARTQLAEGLPIIEGDRVQLQQVILNLIVNAIEAMSGQNEPPRTLLISSEKNQPDGVLVAVRDSGPGLAPQTLERLFDPFYTTKADGMGMGLSICHSIIEAHGGRLWASANQSRGAVFQFTLPANSEPS
jgi:PAS domain S-box-containing protein